VNPTEADSATPRLILNGFGFVLSLNISFQLSRRSVPSTLLNASLAALVTLRLSESSMVRDTITVDHDLHEFAL